MPIVSLCLPTYNGSRYVAEAVRSAVAQTADPATLELVVSDSGSTDGTLDVVRAAAADAPFAVNVLPDRTPGMVPNWNASVLAARGSYIKFLFQDDVLEPNCVGKLLSATIVDTGVTLAFCRRRLIVDPSAEGGALAAYLRQFRQLHETIGPVTVLQEGRTLLGRRGLLRPPWNKVGEPTVVLARRDALIACGLFNERMKQLVDWDMWLRLMAAGKVAFVDDTLAAFRVHGGQMSTRNFTDGDDDGDWTELYRTLARRDVFDALHPAARANVRAETTSATRLPPAGWAERACAVGRSLKRGVRRLRRPPR